MKTRSSASSREPVFAGLVFAGLLTLGTTMGVGCQAPASDTRSSRSGGNSAGDTSVATGINTPGIKTYVSGANALKSGDVKAAEVQLKNAIKENPELRMPHIKLSEIYRQRNDFEQAVPHMEAISKLDPYNQQNMYFLGLGYQLLGRLQDSALAYLRAL